MTASVGFLTALVTFAVLLTIIAPVVLLVLWIKDYREDQLW